MICFRLGQRWRSHQEDGLSPRDSFGLEVDGVNVLPDASNEPLLQTVGRLVGAVLGLMKGERSGQLSLDEAAQELCLWRTRATEVELSVVRLAPGGGQLPSLRIDLVELAQAAASCARQLVRDTQAGRAAPPTELTTLLERLDEIETSVLRIPAFPALAAWTLTRPRQLGLGFSLTDDAGRAGDWTRRSLASLTPLLIPGELITRSGRTIEAVPFLALHALAKAASRDAALVGTEAVPPRVVYEAGLDLCLALRRHNTALSSNPWVEALQARCRDGLVALRQPPPPMAIDRPSPPRTASEAPLVRSGVLRRVTLRLRWRCAADLGERGARLLLRRSGMTVSTPNALLEVSRRGGPVRRLGASRGLAVSPEGAVVAASESRVMAFGPESAGALWMRDHDGARLGPTLQVAEGTLVCPLDRHDLVGFDALTGRERWRFANPRGSRTFSSSLGGLILTGTDAGVIWAIDAKDGAPRLRLQGPWPCVTPPVPWGRGTLCVLNRGELTVVFACEAPAGLVKASSESILWNLELGLAQPSAPVVLRRRTFLGGVSGDRTLVVCLSSRGVQLWERQVPCSPRGLTLLPFEGGVIVCDSRGHITRLLPDGTTEWVSGIDTDPPDHHVAARLHRRLLVVPGSTVRIIEPRGGRTVGAIEIGPDLSALAVAQSFELFAYRESGELTAWRPDSLLAMV
jgi:hypothetical protein